MNKAGILVGSIGVLMLLAGIAMPPTQTQTSTTCVESQFESASGCVQTNYTTPNYGRGVFITLGLALTLGGGFATFAWGDSSVDKSGMGQSVDGQRAVETPKNADMEPASLHARIKQQQEENEEQ